MSYAAELSFKFTVQLDVNCIRLFQRDSMRNWQNITDSVYLEDTQYFNQSFKLAFKSLLQAPKYYYSSPIQTIVYVNVTI